MLSLLLMIAATAQQPSARDLLPLGNAVPGCALDVRREGHVVETAYTGLANLENAAPIGPDTVFEIGSVSKQFIGAGLAILAERGRLKLDDPISKWLPELPPLYRGVTIAMLAHHTSGIRSWNNLAELTGRGEDSTGYDNAWVLAAVARQRALNNVPGAEYLYSNSNFVLGAIIIERASGQRLNDFFHDALFARLGMTRTEWRTDFKEIVHGRAQAYLPTDDGGWQLDMPLNGVAGAGALLSTVGDLQRWNALLAKPGPEDRAWVETVLRPGTLSDGTKLLYGLGIETDPIDGLAGFSHGGSTGSYRAWLGYIPSQDLSVALLCNTGAVNTEDLGPAVAARFIPEAPPHVRIAATASEPVQPLKGVVGVYRNEANDAVVEVKADATGVHLNGGAGFLAAGIDRLVTADGRRKAILLKDPSGRVMGLVVTRINNSSIKLQRVAPPNLLATGAAGLAGAYASDEVDGVQKIEKREGGLLWRDPSGVAHRLVPVYRDAFFAPDASWTLRFIRTPGSRIRLDMSITRARHIAYRRVDNVSIAGS